MTLDEIGLKHNTDKSTRVHGYTLVYPRYLDVYKDKKFNMLEIGVAKGKSLRMWKEYFPNVSLHAIDIIHVASKKIPNGVHFHQGDQEDKAFLDKLAREHGPFDVIIDDGGHYWAQQKASFEALWEHITPGGIYIVEDLNTSYYAKKYKDGTGVNMVDFLKGKIDEVVREECTTDISFIHFWEELCFIRKKLDGIQEG
jgi:hypothetical protein